MYRQIVRLRYLSHLSRLALSSRESRTGVTESLRLVDQWLRVEHESRSILDDRVYVYNASRSPRLRYHPFPHHLYCETANRTRRRDNGRSAILWGSEIRNRGGIPRDSLRERCANPTRNRASLRSPVRN